MTDAAHLTPEGLRVVQDVARRHGVSEAAARELLAALIAGVGRQAQFNHPDLGGMGQWSAGGMIMVGDMFDSGLKARVDALCTELARLLGEQTLASTAPGQSQSQSGSRPGGSWFVTRDPAESGQTGSSRGAWWPAALGAPSSTGAQNGMRYAYFPTLGRLAIDANGQLTVYDTGEHAFRGFSQQQSGGRSLVFTSQHGPVRLADLALVEQVRASSHGPTQASPIRSTTPAPAPAPARKEAGSDPPEDVFGKIERLAELRKKGVLSEQEFADKKRELLARI
jgi:Short C-terminal domain